MALSSGCAPCVRVFPVHNDCVTQQGELKTDDVSCTRASITDHVIDAIARRLSLLLTSVGDIATMAVIRKRVGVAEVVE